MNSPRSFARRIAWALVLGFSSHASMAQITFYDAPDFKGRAFTTDRRLGDLNRAGFNDHAASAVVVQRVWEVCEGMGYRGRCRVLRPGHYPTLQAMGLAQPFASVRVVASSEPIAANQFAPQGINQGSVVCPCAATSAALGEARYWQPDVLATALNFPPCKPCLTPFQR